MKENELMSDECRPYFWAKTSRDHESTSYHPLICHMLDAAGVAEQMWDDVMTPALRTTLAESFGLGEDVVRAWVTLLAGLHDIGKASPGFQARDSEAVRRLNAAGFRFPQRPDDPGHGRVGAVVLKNTLTETFKWSEANAHQIALAVGAHHGTFPRDGELENASARKYCGTPEWEAARTGLAQELAEILGGAALAVPPSVTHAGAMILAGLVSVSDWIASDEQFFEFAAPSSTGPPPGFDLVDYQDQSRSAARRALESLGWLDWFPDAVELTFDDLFPQIASTPRPVQQRIVNLPGITERSGIAILELPMGEGKTEAAFYLADRWSVELGQRGAYIAMPTMATANQMFSRACAFLERRYPDQAFNVQLLHSHAALETTDDAVANDQQLLQPTQTYSDDPDESPLVAQARAGEWFTRRKRGLLAPFGVGTVDQSFLAALQTKHVFVRLFGLSGKTVIFDEVHAYDSYMSTLFERLLEWLGALRSSVIILSATLPDARRAALISAYAHGRDGQPPADIPTVSYPRLSWLGPGGPDVEHIPISTHSRRELGVQWIDGELPSGSTKEFPLGAFLREELADGGCAAVVCNTVRRAQQVYQALQSYFPGTADDGHPELDLFHARYPFQDRVAREQRVLIHFGKPGGIVDLTGGETATVQRPHRAVLVATQVVEQSLDLDFDLMVTDLAPVDLVLQRSGRLQRHDRGDARPARFRGGPVIHVAEPPLEDGVPRFDAGTASVYDEHILLRSWLALRCASTIQIPEDVGSLIESVYDDRDPDQSLSDELASQWEATRTEYLEDQESDRREAEKRWLKHPYHPESINRLVRDPRAEDEPEFHKDLQALTRLSGPTVSIICLHGDPDHPVLDRNGMRPISTDVVPTFSEARELLRRAVTISDRRIINNLLQEEPPANWQGSSLLRRQRMVVFDAENRARVGNWLLRLDPDLGLYVEGKVGE